MDLFASSGGAVNALALVARHPEDVRTLVAHEPPLAAILPDREGALAATEAIADTYQRGGFGPAMAQFIARGGPPRTHRCRTMTASRHPIRRCSTCPTEDDGSRTDPLLGQNIISCTHYRARLRRACGQPRLASCLRRGVESEGEMAHRGAEAAAERLGMTPVSFPSGHGGFLGGEYGQPGDPDGFAAKLREVLTTA